MKKDDVILSSVIAVILCIVIGVIFHGMKGPSTTEIIVGVNSNAGAAVQTTLPTVPTTVAPATTAPSTTQATTQGAAQTETTVPASAESTTAAAENGLPVTPAEILAKYTQVMDKAKSEGPAHKKVEYQAIPEDKVSFEGGVFDKILPLASLFFTTEEDARANPEIREKGGDMYWFPVYKVSKGCLLTDASKIKSATCTEQADGNVKITIVLLDEDNPEPPPEGATSCDNAVGSLFTPIMLADVHNTLQNDSAVKFVVKDVDFDLNYYDCTAELVYNPANDQIVSLDHYMHILIKINSGKVLGMSAVGTAVLDNYLYFSDFQY